MADFTYRFRQAERYLSRIGEVTTARAWTRQARSFIGGGTDPVVGLALIHPFQTEQVFSEVPDLRGPRIFGGLDPLTAQECEAERLWGYACPSKDDLQADHEWPYSLGGPTSVDNLTWLCRLHNQSKGCDIHCWPWERDVPDWLRMQVQGLLQQLA
jgi:hypothetical protein